MQEWAQRMATEDRSRERIKVIVPIYGNVQVDQEELDAMSLNPKFTQYQKVQMSDVDLEKEVCNTKIRWKEQEKIYKRNEEDTGNMRIKVSLCVKDGKVVPQTEEKPMFIREEKSEQKTEEQVMREEIQQEAYREVHDPERKTLDYRKLRTTDVKSCKRVYIPRPLASETEGELWTRNTLVKKVVKEFQLDAKKVKNLTRLEYNGLQKLKRRVQEGSIIVFETDKSGKLAITDKETYALMGRDHVKGDIKVSWKCVIETQKQIQGHLYSLNRVFKTGEAHG